MGCGKKESQMIFELRWKNDALNKNENFNMVGIVDGPATNWDYKTFKTYLLKNAGYNVNADNVRISFGGGNDKERFINNERDFGRALAEFREHANLEPFVLQLEFVNVVFQEVNDDNNCCPKKDMEVQVGAKDILKQKQSNEAPKWFINYMRKFKEELLEELPAVCIGKQQIVSHVSRKLKSESYKRTRKMPLHTLDNDKESANPSKVQRKLESKLERLEHKSLKMKMKKMAVRFSSDSDVGKSSGRSQSYPSVTATDDIDMFDASLAGSSKKQAPVRYVTAGETCAHQWTVVNSGKMRWDSNTVLKYTWGPGVLKPNDTEMPCPCLKPGEQGVIEVILNCPIKPGVYEGHWSFYQRGTRFGTGLICTIHVSEPPVKIKNYIPNPTYDVINVQDAFELVLPVNLLTPSPAKDVSKTSESEKFEESFESLNISSPEKPADGAKIDNQNSPANEIVAVNPNAMLDIRENHFGSNKSDNSNLTKDEYDFCNTSDTYSDNDSIVSIFDGQSSVHSQTSEDFVNLKLSGSSPKYEYFKDDAKCGNSIVDEEEFVDLKLNGPPKFEYFADKCENDNGKAGDDFKELTSKEQTPDKQLPDEVEQPAWLKRTIENVLPDGCIIRKASPEKNETDGKYRAFGTGIFGPRVFPAPVNVEMEEDKMKSYFANFDHVFHVQRMKNAESSSLRSQWKKFPRIDYTPMHEDEDDKMFITTKNLDSPINDYCSEMSVQYSDVSVDHIDGDGVGKLNAIGQEIKDVKEMRLNQMKESQNESSNVQKYTGAIPKDSSSIDDIRQAAMNFFDAIDDRRTIVTNREAPKALKETVCDKLEVQNVEAPKFSHESFTNAMEKIAKFKLEEPTRVKLITNDEAYLKKQGNAHLAEMCYMLIAKRNQMNLPIELDCRSLTGDRIDYSDLMYTVRHVVTFIEKLDRQLFFINSDEIFGNKGDILKRRYESGEFDSLYITRRNNLFFAISQALKSPKAAATVFVPLASISSSDDLWLTCKEQEIMDGIKLAGKFLDAYHNKRTDEIDRLWDICEITPISRGQPKVNDLANRNSKMRAAELKLIANKLDYCKITKPSLFVDYIRSNVNDAEHVVDPLSSITLLDYLKAEAPHDFLESGHEVEPVDFDADALLQSPAVTENDTVFESADSTTGPQNSATERENSGKHVVRSGSLKERKLPENVHAMRKCESVDTSCKEARASSPDFINMIKDKVGGFRSKIVETARGVVDLATGRPNEGEYLNKRINGIRILQDMGFNDRELNCQILAECNDDINIAIHKLLMK